MKTYVPNPDHLELLSKLNQHDRLAGTLGILPNHLIQLLRLTNPEDSTKIIHDLRFTTFWLIYRIWSKRQALYRTYWNILPECSKSQAKKRKFILQEKNENKETKHLHLKIVRIHTFSCKIICDHSRYLQLQPLNESY